MASFNGNIDLLALNGAKVLVGIDEKKKQRPYVCIPLDVNEIRVETSKTVSYTHLTLPTIYSV